MLIRWLLVIPVALFTITSQKFAPLRLMKKNILAFLGCLLGTYFLITLNFGCAQISAPTGGAKDSLPPRLIKASPELKTLNFKGNKISLVFNEYIELQELQNNLVVSPAQKSTPTISYNLKTISIKLKDTLLANTTYSINFGNSIRDVHEGNILKDFTYVFSTGNTIDSLTIEGKVLLAESGKPDSNIIVMLYRNLDDSAVLKTKPLYIAKLNGEGFFTFNHLPEADFKIYALKDGDNGKTYNAKTEIFAFINETVSSLHQTDPIKLFAYAEQKADNNKSAAKKSVPEKKLKYSSNLSGISQDLLQNLELTFNNPLKEFDIQKPLLTDTNYKPIPNYTLTIDSSRTRISLKTIWTPETDYIFILPKETVTDSAGNVLAATDSIAFRTKRTGDYGSVTLRFTNIDLSQHPVIQFFESGNLKFSYPITAAQWSNKLFTPGEYELRILYDLNNNGIWDPGNYSEKLQPENVIPFPQKLAVKADWENERDIKL